MFPLYAHELLTGSNKTKLTVQCNLLKHLFPVDPFQVVPQPGQGVEQWIQEFENSLPEADEFIAYGRLSAE